MTKTMTERLESIIEEGYELIGKANIERGFSFHEKAIFCIKDGILRVYSIEGLEKSKVKKLLKCWTVKQLEKVAKKLEVRTGQPITLEDGVYYDDIFLFDVKDGSAKFYTVQKKTF